MPQSVKYFERCYLASIAAALVSIVLIFDTFSADEIVAGIAVIVVVLGLELLLVLLTSRKRSNITKWILIVLTGLSISTGFGSVMEAFDEGILDGVLIAAQYVLSIAAISYLFQKDSKEYFKKNKDKAAA